MANRGCRSFIVVVVLFACAQERRPPAVGGPIGTWGEAESSGIDVDDDGGDDEGPDVLDVGNGLHDSGADGGGEGGDCPCENVLDGIYVLDATPPASVWFYDPAHDMLSEVGELGCDAPTGAVANSMAIDRSGHAWINYYAADGTSFEGWMYRAPLSDLSDCTDLGYDAQGEWYLMGMGYSVVSAGSTCDTLFLYNSDQYVDYPMFAPGGSQLAWWDDNGNDKIVIGPTMYPVGELTGTGDGRLYAFATVATNESVLVQLSKADGSEVQSYPLDGLDITQAFAFGFWGGDVYFFTETSPGFPTSKVTRLDLDGDQGGGLTIVNGNTGIHVTGAGVSTCASFVPPA
jgi:hypothetical protein